MTNSNPQIVGATPLPEKPALSSEVKEERILCPHCLRTATNGIKCKGICVAESDY
jgi:hypothetical protein